MRVARHFRPRVAYSRRLSLVGPPSYLLTARPEDHGAMWPAVSSRCRRALPARLGWAAALLAVTPQPVVCGERELAELFRWLDSLPNTVSVSIGCARQRAATTARRRAPHVTPI